MSTGKRMVEQTEVRYIARLALTLFALTAAAWLLLALVNVITREWIANIREERMAVAMTAVQPKANRFEIVVTENDGGLEISRAFANETPIGYCVQVNTNGFASVIELLVGIDLNGTVTGVSVVNDGVLTGVDADVASESFLNQYIGRKGNITTDIGVNSISALAGTTVSSKAVTSGVNDALAAILEIESAALEPAEEREVAP